MAPKLELVPDKATKARKRPSETGMSPRAQAWFTAMAEEYGIVDRGGTALLTIAAQAYDRAAAAREVVATEGLTIIDPRSGKLSPHPCTLIERDAMRTQLQAMKNLNLDVEPLQPRAGRPSGSRI